MEKKPHSYLPVAHTGASFNANWARQPLDVRVLPDLSDLMRCAKKVVEDTDTDDILMYGVLHQ